MVSILSQTTIRGLLDIFASSWSVRTVENVFIDAGIASVEDPPVADGARRSAAMQYIAGLDLDTARDTNRFLLVFDEVLGDLVNYNGEPIKELTRLYGRLQRDGFERDQNGKLRATTALAVNELSAPLLTVGVLREHITRLEANMDEDSNVVIGSSKELIESVCMVVLTRTNTPFDADDKLPALAKQAQMALGLDPAGIAIGPAQHSVKRLLGGLSSLAIGVAELRNDIGGGHGRAEVVHLPHRHAHLAAGAALTFARMLLETLEDPKAPWHKAGLAQGMIPDGLGLG